MKTRDLFAPASLAAGWILVASSQAQTSPWESWWLRGIVAAILIGIAIVVYVLRFRNVQTRSHELEKQIEESSQELELRTLQVAQRTQELEALNAIAAVVSRSLDLQEILNNALDKTLEIMGVEGGGGIYLLNEESSLLEIAVYKGLSAHFVAGIDNLALGEGFSGRVAQAGQPMVVRNISGDPRLTRMVVREEGLHSVAIVPLSSKGKVLGTLFALNHGRREFTDQDVQLLTSIGLQIGVAIENARFFEAEQRRAEEFRVISEVGHRITSILPVEELLGEIARLLKETLGYYLVGIGLVEGNELIFKAGAGAVWETPDFRPPRLQVGREGPDPWEPEGITGWVAHSGKPLLVPDVSQEPRYYSLPEASEIRSELAVPLITKEKVIGVLHVQSDRLHAFNQHDATVVQSLANQAAVAIENARLYAQAQRRAEEQAVLNELGQALTAQLNVDQVLDEAYRGASRLLDTTSFYIALYNSDKDTVTFALDVTEGNLRKPYSTRKAARGLTEHIIRQRAPLLIQEGMPERLEELGIELIGPVALSWLGVPLMIGDRVLGVIAIQDYSTPRAYDEHDRDLLTAIASQAAIALQNAHLFEETEGRAERLAVINRIASAASATLHLDDLMETVYRETAPAFHADAFFIALYDEEAQELDFRFRVDQGVREPSERLPLGVGWSSIVVTEKKPLVIRDEDEGKRLLPSPRLFGTMKHADSWLGAPMLVGERVVGVISVQAYRPHAWDDEDQLLLFTIADQVAVALENAHLFDEVQQRIQELEALYRADEHLYRHLDLDQVLRTLVDVAVDILKADKSSLMVWDDSRERLVVRAARGFSSETLSKMSFAPGEGLVGVVAITGEPAVVEDTLKDPRVIRRITEAEGIRSFMHAPIEISAQIFGVFNVDFVHPRAFGDDEKRLFMALAQRAALAIQNAQLYEKAQELAVVQERQRLARDLHDAVTQTLFSASLIAEVLPALWDKDQDKARAYLKQLRQLSRGALAEMRTLLLELRPAALIEAKLGDLLRQLAEAVTGQTGTPVTLTVEHQVTLPPDVHVALYRIAQEALNNVVKHAHADQVTVSLRCVPSVSPAQGKEQGRLELVVSDDGDGFDTSSIPADRLGLGIMHERAQAIRARLEIESQVGHGTRVRVFWSED
jgi:GAF domain-containing protein